MTELNIVELIEQNPITRLSSTYNNKMLIKIKENFNDFEQQLFVSSFYCYLNYDEILDFIVDLDNIWKWLGFSTKFNAKNLLEKNFKINIDYNIGNLHSETASGAAEAVKKNGGQNIKKIMLNIKCFKGL